MNGYKILTLLIVFICIVWGIFGYLAGQVAGTVC